MGAAKKIEHPIRNFSQQELEELNGRLESFYPLPVDLHLKMNLDTGQMDALIRQALADHEAGKTRVL
jgi:hypothetical protein